MYIEPNTTIKLLKGVPMDNNYRDSLYFATIAEQTAYFESKVKHTLIDQYYQRKDRGFIRVQLSMAQCFDCNYIMYKNTSFEDKWLYAFITGVNYINNSTTEIQFEVDILQTWYFDYEMDECYILREHVPDDTIGLHTLPEDVDTGGYYVCNDEDYLLDFSDCTVLLFSTWQYVEQGEWASGGQILSGIYQGSYCYPFPMHDYEYDGETITQAQSVAILNNFLDLMTKANQVESVTGILLVPDAIVPNYDITYTQGVGGLRVISSLTWSTGPREYTRDTPVSRPATLNNYVPRNNKLFTFPYSLLYVHNTLGDGQMYRWECFGNNRGVGVFRLESQISPTPEAIAIPYEYKGQSRCFDESIPMSEYPMLSFNYDAFKAWIAGGGLARDIINLAGNVAGGMLAGSIAGNNGADQTAALTGRIGAGIGIATGAANFIADVAIHSIQPNGIKGSQQGSTMIANRLLGYKCLSLTVRREVAVTIDNYFTRFGYKVCARKHPNRKNRTRYTFIQTDKSTLSGSIPVNDASRICQIYDSGITWWADHDNVGNYSYTNATL